MLSVMIQSSKINKNKIYPVFPLVRELTDRRFPVAITKFRFPLVLLKKDFLPDNRKDHFFAERDLPVFRDVSTRIWILLGHSASYRKPWFERWEVELKHMHHTQLACLDKVSRKLQAEGIDVRSYARLAALASPKDQWDRLAKLFVSFSFMAWTRKLRDACAQANISLEDLLEVAGYLMSIQVEKFGKCNLTPTQIIGPMGDRKGFKLFHDLLDKLYEIHKIGVDPQQWIDLKVLKIDDKFGNQEWYFRNIINHFLNPTDAELEKIKIQDASPWSDIIRFLGLDPDVKFAEGYIPKGFQLAQYHANWGGKFSDVSIIGADGYYYTKTGDRFLGQFHYARQDGKLCVKVTPENFEKFKEDWYNIERINQVPTWEEMQCFGAHKDLWNEDGSPTVRYLKKVSWRR